ncbi:NAD(P)H-dependent flavin oxidoreductase [Acrocarpospora catenulata]|uniref:NAD(P)H-dependent flavin oxidoreductase n=1 Tax=Acrocarpospora catenulata TaxID=2836182 RepID=UPI002023A0CF|nr:nitronate monooxygenase family protein [Acrocarpospora catenulata]
MNKFASDFGIEYPIFAFSHCRDVVAAVSRAGGVGVLGILAMQPEQIAIEMKWLDDNCAGKPYGVDVVIPVRTVDRESGLTDAAAVTDDLAAMIPAGHRAYAEALMEKFGVPPAPPATHQDGHGFTTAGFTAAGGAQQIDAVLEGNASFLVSALGPPPADIVEAAHRKGIKVGTLVGKPHQAARSAATGVDFIIAQSYEAAAHTGEIGSMVLIPDVVDAVGDVPVLAAGGIGTGRQMAAAMCLGAKGVWTGSIWLTTHESGTDPWMMARMCEMTSTDTVRSKAQTGKPNRQMRTPWTEAWDDPQGPGCLPMPLQYMLFAEYTDRARRAGVNELVGSPVGQIVSRMNRVRSVSEVVYEIVEEYADTMQRVSSEFSLPEG